jgi:hypothetical protein
MPSIAARMNALSLGRGAARDRAQWLGGAQQEAGEQR